MRTIAASVPSGGSAYTKANIARRGDPDEGRRLTDTCDDLTLQSKLIRIPGSNPADLAPLAHRGIRRILDLVPHVPARKGEDHDDRQDTPDDARLDQGEDVGVERVDADEDGEEYHGDDDKGNRVEGFVEVERDWGEVPHPGVEWRGGESAAQCQRVVVPSTGHSLPVQLVRDHRQLVALVRTRKGRVELYGRRTLQTEL
jgi:hypothetical protein